MSLKKPFIDLMEKHILESFGSYSDLHILELGNQIVRPDRNIKEHTGKQYWTNRGMKHVSVDVNGKHGSLTKDLTQISDFVEYENKFDIVYNAGTTEHVEPYEDQYTCFQIVDMCCKPGGLMIHGVPEITNRDQRGMWADHCHYYYSTEFFQMLADDCGYELLHLKLSPTSITSVLRKTDDSTFMQDKDKFLSNIAVRNQKVDFSNNADYTHQKKQAKFKS